MFTVTSICVISCLQLNTERNVIFVISCIHLLQNVFTNLSLLQILLYKVFNHFQKQSQEYSMKKLFSNILWYSQEKNLWWGLFFNKVADHQTCGFIKKRLQHRSFLANFGEFLTTSILKNICERLHFWKVFGGNIFLDQNLAKETFDDLLCERLLKLIKIEQKCFLQ